MAGGLNRKSQKALEQGIMEIEESSLVWVIVNPSAGGGKAAKIWPAVEIVLRKHYPSLHVVKTESRNHATELCRQGLRAGASLVISVGGDGTNNEVLSGFMDSAGRNQYPQACLAWIAAGTGADFQRMFPSTTWQSAIETMVAASPRRVDYGLVEQVDQFGRPKIRPFLNIASVGLSGLVDHYLLHSKRMAGSKLAYIGASLRAILNYRVPEVEIKYDDDDYETRRLTLLVAANGQYFGGGMWICPNAELDDGKLDAVILGKESRLSLLGLMAKVFHGRHVGDQRIDQRQVSVISITSSETVLLDIDGEAAGRLPARFSLVPRGLRIKAPK